MFHSLYLLCPHSALRDQMETIRGIQCPAVFISCFKKQKVKCRVKNVKIYLCLELAESINFVSHYDCL